MDPLDKIDDSNLNGRIDIQDATRAGLFRFTETIMP
jgi:hypothetical protein